MTSRRTDVFVADTHALVWYFRNDKKLARGVRDLIARAESGDPDIRLLISTIVLAELTTLAERKMPEISIREVLRRLDASPSVVVVPFDEAIFLEMLALPPALELHDRMIA
ncbi:MAG TPA: PIN domain-containing protein, partial [Dehalococcoidia bacterium]